MGCVSWVLNLENMSQIIVNFRSGHLSLLPGYLHLLAYAGTFLSRPNVCPSATLGICGMIVKTVLVADGQTLFLHFSLLYLSLLLRLSLGKREHVVSDSN